MEGELDRLLISGIIFHHYTLNDEYHHDLRQRINFTQHIKHIFFLPPPIQLIRKTTWIVILHLQYAEDEKEKQTKRLRLIMTEDEKRWSNDEVFYSLPHSCEEFEKVHMLCLLLEREQNSHSVDTLCAYYHSRLLLHDN